MIALEQIDLTAAQKADARHYPAESCIVFNRISRMRPRGERIARRRYAIGNRRGGKRQDRAVPAEVHRSAYGLPPGATLALFRRKTAAQGERRRRKRREARQRRNRYGRQHYAEWLDSIGGWTHAARKYRQFQRGYAVTSYGSQGKTVDRVLFADAGVCAATNAQQWYVTISRGRKSVQIFTSDREQLRQSIARNGDRELALDLVNTAGRSLRLREGVRRNIHRGHEFARRLCRAAMRAWVAAFVKSETQHVNETPSREQQQSVRANVLAT